MDVPFNLVTDTIEPKLGLSLYEPRPLPFNTNESDKIDTHTNTQTQINISQFRFPRYLFSNLPRRQI